MGKETLIHVNNKNIQHDIKMIYGIDVPMYMVFCIERKTYNSSLWFEMWDDHEYINNKKEEKMEDYGTDPVKKIDDNTITGGQLIIFLIVFLGIICIICFIGSEFYKTNDTQKKEKERIELNGKTYIEE